MAVLVAIILIFSLAALIQGPPRELSPLPEEEGPPWVDPEPDMVDEDTVWSDRVGALEAPTIVRSGAKLTIDRCNLTVDLLDLVLGNASWISVEPGSELTLVDTRLSIVYDKRLEDAVFVPFSYPRGGPRSISRAVNLEGTTEPVLSLDVFWWRMATALVVGVQTEPGAPLQTIATLGPPDDDIRRWRHFELPLDEYRGTIVRVVLFPSDGQGAADVVVGKVQVVDGSSIPWWDELRTGRVWEDLWLMRGFQPFFEEFRGEHQKYMPLIEASGDLRLTNAILEAPGGLPRGTMEFASGKFSPENLPPQDRLSVTQDRIPTVGHVTVQGALLSLVESELRNVPVSVKAGQVDLRASDVSGDVTLLMVLSSWGLIEASDLACRPLDPIFTAEHPIQKDAGTVLAVDFNSSSGPLRVRGCNLSGGGRGLDLHHAWVEVDGCSFEGQEQMAIWDHASVGLGSWEEVNGSNTFDDLGCYAFLRTHNAVLELTGPGRPSPGGMGYFTGIPYWEGQDDPYFWQILTRIDVLVGHVLMPTELVDASMAHTWIEEVRIDLSTSWGGVAGFPMDTSATSLTVVLDPDLVDAPHRYTQGFMRVTYDPGPMPGDVNLTILARVPDDYLDGWWVGVVLDGELRRALTPEEAMDSPYGNYNAMFLTTVDVGPGTHVLDIQMMGVSDEGEDLLATSSRVCMRANDAGQADEARRFLEAGGGVLMLDPVVDLEVSGPLTLADGVGSFVLEAFLGEGAHLDARDLATPPDVNAWFEASGPGTIDLSNVTTGRTVARATDCVMRISDTRCEDLSIMASGCEVRLSNLTAGALTGMEAFNVGSLILEDLTIEAQDRQLFGYIYGSNVTLRRICATSDGDGIISLSANANGSLTVVSSTFLDCLLDIWSYEENNVSLCVTDCDFVGNRSGLMISWDPLWRSGGRAFLDGSRVEGNRLRGGNLVCHPNIADTYLSDNMMEDGARYVMWFDEYARTDGMPENASWVRARVDADERSAGLGREVLGQFYNQWSGLFVEGTLEPPHFTEERVVHLCLVAVDRPSEDWVCDFASVPLPYNGEPIAVLEWEDISGLVAPLVASV